MTSPSGPSRRQVLAAAAGRGGRPADRRRARAGGRRGHGTRKTYDLTVLGTSDTHGNVYNWDYYRDAEYDDSAHNDIGVAKLATLVNQIRAERRGKATLVLDAGDTIQGTPLATYYAKQEPITATGEKHPMARAMNVIDYDAVTLGNHEFNYGLPLLRPVDPPARLPGAGRQRGQRADRQAGLHAVRHQEGLPRARRADPAGRHPRPDQPRRGHLGPGQRRGQAALRRHDRDRREVGADHAGRAAPTSC